MDIQAFWSRKGLFNYLLHALSLPFGLVVWLRRLAYRMGLLQSGHPGVPVIVVGNLTIGGSGKTPFVIWLVEWLRHQGRKPGVVSRGHGRQNRDLREVSGASSAAEVGDEPLLIHAKTGVPVVVGQDRLQAARLLCKRHPEVDVIVSDDGLQHYRLKRDLELVLADAAAPFGNGWLLPAGPLREPVSRLGKADALILSERTKTAASMDCSAVPVFRVAHRAGRFYNLKDPSRSAELAYFRGRLVTAVAAIARPEAFFAMLKQDGLNIRRCPFPDHHPFAAGEIEPTATVVMTEKDAVKCRALAGADWWVRELEVVPDPKLEAWLLMRLAALKRKEHGSQTA